jgi:hypothetical protein
VAGRKRENLAEFPRRAAAANAGRQDFDNLPRSFLDEFGLTGMPRMAVV